METIVKGAKEPLLGLREEEALGIIKIKPGREQVEQLDMFAKLEG